MSQHAVAKLLFRTEGMYDRHHFSSSLASNMDVFAGAEQLTYGELAVREMETFIVIFSLAMVPSAHGMKGEVKPQHRRDVMGLHV